MHPSPTLLPGLLTLLAGDAGTAKATHALIHGLQQGDP